MCDYCKVEENGDIPDTREDILVATIGPFCQTVKVGNRKIYIGTDVDGTTISELCFETDIRYCPMCGRKL